jgi:hypothetical protein
MNMDQNIALMIGGVILAILVLLILGLFLIWGFRGTGYGMIEPGMRGSNMGYCDRSSKIKRRYDAADNTAVSQK